MRQAQSFIRNQNQFDAQKQIIIRLIMDNIMFVYVLVENSRTMSYCQ